MKTLTMTPQPGHLLLPVLLALALGGCTHVRLVDPRAEPPPTAFEEIRARAAAGPAHLAFADGSRVYALDLRLRADTTAWRDPVTGEPRRVPTGDVREVAFRRGGRGALQGLGIGLATGAAVGAAVGAATYQPCTGGFFSCGPDFGRDGQAAAAALVVGAAGGLIGAAIGAAVGSRDRYHLLPPRSPAPRAAGFDGAADPSP